MTEDRTAKKIVNNNLSQIERVTIALQSFGTQEVSFTVDDLAAMCGMEASATYQVLYRLQSQKKIEIVTIPIGDTGRRKVAGAKLLRLESATDILNRVPKRVERNGTDNLPKVKKEREGVRGSIPLVVQYMEQKIAVDRVQEQLQSVGLNTYEFEVNPYAEEGVYLLNEWIKLHKEYLSQSALVETLQREIRVLKGIKQAVPDMPSENNLPIETKEALEAVVNAQ